MSKFRMAVPQKKCFITGQTVYTNDPQITVEETLFLKSAFKCQKCNCQLTVSNYTFVKDESLLLCKTHYNSAFQESGGKYLGGQNFKQRPASTPFSKSHQASSPQLDLGGVKREGGLYSTKEGGGGLNMQLSRSTATTASTRITGGSAALGHVGRAASVPDFNLGGATFGRGANRGPPKYDTSVTSAPTNETSHMGEDVYDDDLPDHAHVVRGRAPPSMALEEDEKKDLLRQLGLNGVTPNTVADLSPKPLFGKKAPPPPFKSSLKTQSFRMNTDSMHKPLSFDASPLVLPGDLPSKRRPPPQSMALNPPAEEGEWFTPAQEAEKEKKRVDAEEKKRADDESRSREAENRLRAEQEKKKAQEDRQRAEQADLERQQREAQEKSDRERREREAQEKSDRERRQREAQEKLDREQREREAQEKLDRERQDREAQEQLDRQRREHLDRERRDREAQEQLERERLQKEAQEKAAADEEWRMREAQAAKAREAQAAQAREAERLAEEERLRAIEEKRLQDVRDAEELDRRAEEEFRLRAESEALKKEEEALKKAEAARLEAEAAELDRRAEEEFQALQSRRISDESPPVIVPPKARNSITLSGSEGGLGSPRPAAKEGNNIIGGESNLQHLLSSGVNDLIDDMIVDDDDDCAPKARHIKFASRDTFQELVCNRTTPPVRLRSEGDEFMIPSKAKLEALAESKAEEFATTGPTAEGVLNWLNSGNIDPIKAQLDQMDLTPPPPPKPVTLQKIAVPVTYTTAQKLRMGRLPFMKLKRYVMDQGITAAELETEIIGTTSAMCKFAIKRGIDMTPLLD